MNEFQITIKKPSYRERKGLPERKRRLSALEIFPELVRTDSIELGQSKKSFTISNNRSLLLPLIEHRKNSYDHNSYKKDSYDHPFELESIASDPHMDIKLSKFHEKKELSSTMVNNYIIIKNLGNGSYGDVFLVLDNTNNELYAMKVIHLNDNIKVNKEKSAMREVSILKEIKHKNIALIREIIHDEKNYVFIVMDYVRGGHLLKRNETETKNIQRYIPLSEKIVQKYLYEITAGLQYLHNHNIVHKDIKPENILIDKDDNIRIVDFGISEIVDDDHIINEKSGTLSFCAPEMFETGSKIDGFAIDVWGLGITLYLMLYGMFPFNGKKYEDFKDVVLYEKLRFPQTATSSQKDLLIRILEKDPKKRYKLGDIRKHEFLGSYRRNNKVLLKR